MARYIKLSYDLSEKGAYPPAIPKTRTRKLYSLQAGDNANVYEVYLTTHSGTHVDAPFHVIENGAKITGFELEEFIYTNPCCIEITLNDKELIMPEHFKGYLDGISRCDLLLIKTDFGKHRVNDPERYIHRNPGFSVKAAQYLRDTFPELRGLGLDTPSLAAIDPAYLDEGMEAHKVLLGGENRHFVIYEDLNLGYDLMSLKQVIAMPWFVEDVDSAPCTVLGVIA